MDTTNWTVITAIIAALVAAGHAKANSANAQLQEAEQMVYFTHMGRLATHIGYAHMVINIDTRDIKQAAQSTKYTVAEVGKIKGLKGPHAEEIRGGSKPPTKT